MMDLPGWVGLLVGAIIVSAIQLTIGNPFMWLDEKLRGYRRKRWHFKSKDAALICQDGCFWGYKDCPHVKKEGKI